MARTKDKALYTVTVTRYGVGQIPLKLNFTSEAEAYEVVKTLRKRDDVEDVHMGPGYKIYKTADEALETFMMWMH